ncbi:MAG: FliH/SctL family protein [Rhizobacter sp.]
MDALIRSIQWAPSRTRLSERPGTDSAAADAANATTSPSPARSRLESLREEIGTQVRSELAAHMQELANTEHERARIDGFAAGMAEAKLAAAKELAQACEKLKAQAHGALSAMEQAHQAVLAKLQSNVGEVAFAAVCRLAGRKAASQEFVMGVVEHTCAQLRSEVVATVRLHPRDVNTLRDLLQDQELRVRTVGLKVVSDESLELGGCVIEAASGQYDGGLESQLRRLHAVLAGPTATGQAHAWANPGERPLSLNNP